jgi:hypothetical protein
MERKWQYVSLVLSSKVMLLLLFSMPGSGSIRWASLIVTQLDNGLLVDDS